MKFSWVGGGSFGKLQIGTGACREAGDVSEWEFHIPGLQFQERKVAAHPKDAQHPPLLDSLREGLESWCFPKLDTYLFEGEIEREKE